MRRQMVVSRHSASPSWVAATVVEKRCARDRCRSNHRPSIRDLSTNRGGKPAAPAVDWSVRVNGHARSSASPGQSRSRARESARGCTRSAAAASAWLDPAAETAASRLMQQSGGAGDAAALVLAVQAFVANGGGRPAGCCIAGADGQSWPCRSAWLLAFPIRPGMTNWRPPRLLLLGESTSVGSSPARPSAPLDPCVLSGTHSA